MTEAQQSLLKKFGFRLENGKVKHAKLGIVKEQEEFERYTDLEELREHIKHILRNQCLWKRSER